MLLAASPDARYVAENGIFNGTAAIREIPTGKSIATLQGSVSGFSSDGTRIVVGVGTGGSAEVQVATWSDQKVVWQYKTDKVSLVSAQRLENGNTLLVDDSAPRIFEVSPDSKVVWSVEKPEYKGMAMRRARRTARSRP